MALNISSSVDSFTCPSTYTKRFSFSRSRSFISHLESNYTNVCIDGLSVKVPSCLVQCFDYIQENGIVEGIFRVNGSVKRISQYIANPNIDNWTSVRANPHDISGVIKKYLNSYLGDTSVFDSTVTKEIRNHYFDYINQILAIDCDDNMSIDSFKTARTSYDCRPLAEFLEKVVQSMLGEKLQDKNHLFIYIIHNLNLIMQHAETTKMSSYNLAIIFQPYFFDNSDISNIQDLPLLQEILQIIIENSPKLISEYSIEAVNLQDSNSLLSVDSPLTNHGNNSTESYIATEITPRKRSISSRFSTLLDNYYVPIGNTTVGKPKRYSLNVPLDQLSTPKMTESKPIDPKYIDIKSVSVNEIHDTSTVNSFLPVVETAMPIKANTNTKKSNRKSFIALFKNSSSLSVNSEESKDGIYNGFNNSADNILIANNPIAKDQQNFVKRSFSLKIRSKK